MGDPVTTYSVDENGVALLRLDRPKARNAINTAMLEELIPHLEAAKADESLRALGVTFGGRDLLRQTIQQLVDAVR